MISSDPEPFEVYMLKKQLANLTCNCSICEKHSLSESCREESKGSDKGTQMDPVIEQILKNNLDAKVDILCNNVSCPSCFIALNLLKTRETKFCKDEDTETNSGLSCCDKSTEECVKFIERSTSMQSFIKPAKKDSSTSICEKNTVTRTINGIMKKRSNEHVSFLDYVDKDVTKQELQVIEGSCFCLQNFIESIRPPLADRNDFYY